MANTSKQAILKKEDPFITSLILIIIDEYGTEALNWDPTTIRMELEEDFNVRLSPETLDKICVGMQLMTTDDFYRSLPDFNTYCTVLSNDSCSQNSWEPADIYDITEAMAEVQILNPPDKPIEEVLDPEIKGYIEVMLKEAHILTPPHSLSFISPANLAVQELGGFASEEGEMLFQAGYETALENSEDLQRYENDTLTALTQELQSLTLEHGSLNFLKNLIPEREKQDENQSDDGASGSGIQSILYDM